MTMPQSVRDRLIVAIDVPDIESAEAMIAPLRGVAGYFKLGLGLAPVGGFDLARRLIAEGEKVFLDLKLFDIHETVKQATMRCAELGAHILTLQGDPHVVRAARAGRDAVAGTPLKLFAVTILTSLDQGDIDEIGFTEPLADLALRRAREAEAAGADGVITSGHEAARMRAATGPGLKLITPGIRPAGGAANDQKRIMTPADAVRAGADHIVVGRPITGAADPRAAAEAILQQMQDATP